MSNAADGTGAAVAGPGEKRERDGDAIVKKEKPRLITPGFTFTASLRPENKGKGFVRK
jgi:hypothetical protein